MNDRLRESVSVVMDGEADDLELRRLLAGVDQPDTRSAWRNFHLQRDAMAGADLRFAHVDLSRRVWNALADEAGTAVATESAQRPGRRWRPFAGIAVAASVAAIVVVGMRGGIDGYSDAGPGIAESRPASTGKVFPTGPSVAAGDAASQVSVNVPAAAPEVGASAAAMTVSAGDELAQEQLDRYLPEHTESAAINNGQGLINFARVPDVNVD